MAPDPSKSPYPGLRPFQERDAEFFFGREREIRIIAANIQTEPLTVLYGASGVGKSSLLQAGVIPELKRDGRDSNAIYFREWHDNSKVANLIGKISALSESAGESEISRLQEVPRSFLLLDQFEEFLLYHLPDSELGKDLDAALARLINRSEAESGVLIGIREDSLSELDQRFSLRIPGLFNNTLAVQYLTTSSARLAIESPLAKLAEQCGENYMIDPELVEEILKAASTPRRPTNSPNPAPQAGDENARVEPVYLQLVLKRLWNEALKPSPGGTSQQQPWVMHSEMLRLVGGADRIVESHVDEVMKGLRPQSRRDIAVRLFPHLVTPSGRKIAQSTRDLLDFSAAPEAETRAVLAHLSEGEEARILRRLVAPDMFELFHDVLAQPVLVWRRRYLSLMERRRLKLRWILYTAISIVVVAIVLSAWIIYKQQVENAQLALAQAAAETVTMMAKARAEKSNAEAQEAKASGDLQNYEALLAQARHDQATALEAQKAASALKSPDQPQAVVDLANQQVRLSQEVSDLQAKLDAALLDNKKVRQAYALSLGFQGTNADRGTKAVNASMNSAAQPDTGLNAMGPSTAPEGKGIKPPRKVPETIGSIFEYEQGKTCTIITSPVRIVGDGYARVPEWSSDDLYIFAMGNHMDGYEPLVISKSERAKLGDHGRYSNWLPVDFLADLKIEAKKVGATILNNATPGDSEALSDLNYRYQVDQRNQPDLNKRYWPDLEDRYRLNLIGIEGSPLGDVLTVRLNICEEKH